jgi:hypothetical protein
MNKIDKKEFTRRIVAFFKDDRDRKREFLFNVILLCSIQDSPVREHIDFNTISDEFQEITRKILSDLLKDTPEA